MAMMKFKSYNSSVKAMVFLVLMYGCESWTIKKVEHWRINAFELGCWRRLLRVPWTARRPNKSILKEISAEHSLEGWMLKLKLQYFGNLMWKINADGDCSLEIKRLILLGRKVMTNLDSILKSRDITLPTKVCLVKATVFPVVMYGCESGL